MVYEVERHCLIEGPRLGSSKTRVRFQRLNICFGWLTAIAAEQMQHSLIDILSVCNKFARQNCGSVLFLIKLLISKLNPASKKRAANSSIQLEHAE